jgi:hypothetical protein
MYCLPVARPRLHHSHMTCHYPQHSTPHSRPCPGLLIACLWHLAMSLHLSHFLPYRRLDPPIPCQQRQSKPSHHHQRPASCQHSLPSSLTARPPIHPHLRHPSVPRHCPHSQHWITRQPCPCICVPSPRVCIPCPHVCVPCPCVCAPCPRVCIPCPLSRRRCHLMHHLRRCRHLCSLLMPQPRPHLHIPPFHSRRCCSFSMARVHRPMTPLFALSFYLHCRLDHLIPCQQAQPDLNLHHQLHPSQVPPRPSMPLQRITKSTV